MKAWLGWITRILRGAWRPTAVVLLCCTVLAATGAAGEVENKAPRRPVLDGDGEAIGLMSRPSMAPQPGAASGQRSVLVVHDAMGIDGRAERYVQQLLGAGFVVLEIELAAISADGMGGPMPDDAEAAARIMRALAALAPKTGAPRLGVLGFGAGARAVALMPADIDGMRVAARVLLYPGCEEVRSAMTTMRPAALLPSSPVLLLHGSDDPSNLEAACSALATTLEEAAPVRRIAYAGASYAWDLPAVGGLEQSRLETPGGRGIVVAWHWPELTEFAAALVAAFLCHAVGGCR